MTTEPYFSARTGQHYTFRSVAEAIHEDHPHLDGKHIFVQLDAVDLRAEFDAGDTPYGLPYSFTDYLPGGETRMTSVMAALLKQPAAPYLETAHA